MTNYFKWIIQEIKLLAKAFHSINK